MLWPGAIIPHMIAGGGGAASFPVVETTATTIDNSGAAQTVNLPSGIVSGNLLLVFASFIGGTDATPAGWTEEVNSPGLTVLSRVADGSEGSTLDIYSTTPSKHTAVALRISTFQGTPEFATDSFGNPPELIPSWGSDKNLWLAVILGADDIAPLGTIDTAPTNYGNLLTAINDAVTAAYVGLARRELEAGSEDPGTFGVTDLGVSDPVAVTVAIRGA